MADKKKRSVFSAFADLVLGLELEEDEFENEDNEELDNTIEDLNENTEEDVIQEQKEAKTEDDVIKEEIAVSVKKLLENNNEDVKCTNKDEMDTVISKSVVINGDLSSDTNTTYVYGAILGNVKCNGHLIVYGTITGNVETDNL